MNLPSLRDLLLKKLPKEDCRLDILRDQERDVIKILVTFRVVFSCVSESFDTLSAVKTFVIATCKNLTSRAG